MSTYLLLRDNKQSGPHSLEEMKAKGFKKYDLVWVEGKSAAWRYPGEVEEFKAFAPIVEEQPFDRFFRRPSEEKKEARPAQESLARPIQNAAEVVTASPKQIVVETGNNRKVYATLPAKRTSGNSHSQTVFQSLTVKEEIRIRNSQTVTNNYPITEEPEIPQEEISVHYAQKNIKVKKTSSYRQYLQPIGAAACIIALLGGGIFIGMSIKQNAAVPTDTNQSAIKEVAKIDKPESQNVSIPISTSVPTETKPNLTEKQFDEQSNTAATNAESKSPEKDKKSELVIDRKKANKPRINAAADLPKIIAQPESITNNDSTGVASRHSTHRSDAAINDKEFVKNSIANLVSVSSNKYNVGTFGGISELQLTVSNKSVYPLDLVMVEVQYVQANKKVYKTENIFYRNVRPGESIMQEAPKSSRGIKIQYKIAIINSKESSVSYSGI
jgi:hypothetical protein